MSTTETPYLETFGCRFDDGEGCDHDGYCDWGWACGTCGRPVDDGPCPDHAPLDVPGLMLTECTTAEPRHPRTWVLASDSYGAPCMYCAYDAVSSAHAGCAHSHHWPWRRWTVTHKVLHWLVLAGVTRGGWFTHDSHCRGCVDHLSLGRGDYLLGQENEWWTCLLRQHHLRKPDPDCPAFCNVCTPPDVGSA